MVVPFMIHLSGSGVYFGQLDFNPQEVCDNITTETRLLQYPGINVDRCCYNSFDFLIILAVNTILRKFNSIEVYSWYNKLKCSSNKSLIVFWRT